MAQALEKRDGVEVRVETGLGHIVNLDPPKGRNAHLQIDADGLRIPIQGWVDTTNFELYDRCLQAHQEGRRIGYRVVIKRKPDQDPTVPLEAIDRYNRVRDVEEIQFVGGNATAPPSTDRPAAPPEPSPAPPKPVPAAVPPAEASGRTTAPAAPASTGPCRECHAKGDDHAPGCKLANPEPSPTDPNDGDPGPTEPSPPARARNVVDGKRGPRVAEGRPWEAFNSDGSLNLGSYSAQASTGSVLLAHDLLLAKIRTEVAAGERPAGQFPSMGQVRALARRLLAASDRCQATIRTDGHVDRMDASHTRSRAAVRAALDSHPVPWGADPEEVDAWVIRLGDYAAGLLGQAIALIDPEER